jgi:hypothetical protein
MNRPQYENWVPGGVLRVYSKRYNVWHFGILTWLYGQAMVMHASKERGHFVLTTLDEFAEGEPMQYCAYRKCYPVRLPLKSATYKKPKTEASLLRGLGCNTVTWR